ncbi:HutD/Ves family protein [Sporomusa acidovorans]|uniref:Protein Ves n=1 Tax=Sporomusa acidovorans (strain ATCC 49682 / DSM 3132 / Mol) TaxID=1123286 RepID=A0ABZ3J0V2_SPOA4|nr:HutD family protein [Sporomusa acidovorans]OZC22824.1 protein Ves [Sporomusa acidovorans DSM 3132]SDE52110.1 HutD protein [Sporomusa acidovorans]
MTLSFELIRKNEQTTSNWSGGTTTQIAIYPNQAVYAERNFIWRISSARVDLSESTFTSLPGVARLIMVLEGEMRLEHAGHHSCYLKPFAQDSFSGDWTTKSYGKVRDFNLMLKGSTGGKLTALTLPVQTDQQVDIHNPQTKNFRYMTSAFYCVGEAATVMVPHRETYTLTAGDVVLITTDQTESVSACLTNPTNEQVHIIRTDIWYQ